MLRSLYSGISGMKNFQTELDVIGNNISNVNTSGFKKGRATFQDMFSQMTTGAQGSTDTRGGINPIQVGLGSQLGSIDNPHSQGFLQPTDRMLDFAIEGEGMFVVANDPVYEDNDENIVDIDETDVQYSRAGNFYMDNDGYVVNSDGSFLMGFQVDGEDVGEDLGKIHIPEDAKDFSVGNDGKVNFINENGDTTLAGQVSIASFSNPEGLQKDGGNLYLDSPNAGYNGLYTPETEGLGSIHSSTLEMSNVDLAEEFSDMITAQRSFQANTRIINTSDEILQELVNLKR